MPPVPFMWRHRAGRWPGCLGPKVPGRRSDRPCNVSIRTLPIVITVGDRKYEPLASQRRVLWAAGKAKRWIRIVPTKITGRRIWADEI